MNQLIAAGGERISKVGAKLANDYIYASQTYLIKWTQAGPQQTWSLGSTITCVASNEHFLFAGTQEGKLWQLDLKGEHKPVLTLESSITCIDATAQLVLIGCSDGYVYTLGSTEKYRPNNRFYPLAISYDAKFDIIAFAGTSTNVFLMHRGTANNYVELPGHENWIKALDFCHDGQDLILASAAQDRYIRLWRISSQQYDTDVLSSSLTTTVYKINDELNCLFDALLIGHDDWVVDLKWQPTEKPQLLSASGDSSLIIWSSSEAQDTDEEMQVWTPTVRLGDVSIMGASTATGATGGFWTAEWFDEATVATLSRTGSWRVWKLISDEWVSQPSPTGHTKPVTSVAWFGSSLLTTSLDQTTRLWAKLGSDIPGLNAFYELNRPQIHGFDMNCVAVINGHSIVSAGDEKTMRVFNAPKIYHDLLTNLTNETTESSDIAAASVPALGLSNKASDDTSVLDCSILPHEAELQRLTLWPEVEKIYGHGYEIVCIDVSPDGEYVASCCRANSARHAVVRIYTTNKWRQLEPLNAEHTLTITRVRFSPDSKHLLSVSRDRQWSVFDTTSMASVVSKPKAHSRIIWDCCWLDSTTFLTVSRDKQAKVWNVAGECLLSATFEAPITACHAGDKNIFIGLETGTIYKLSSQLEIIQTLEAEGRINQLAVNGSYLAVASDTVRIFKF